MVSIPEKCKFIFETLYKNGFMCYAVGGCVRDSLMGRIPLDWDFTTDAKPEEIEICFSDYKTVDIGKKYGTITVINKEDSFEITTFRCDGVYSDTRHPDAVTFATSINDDLSRRDFTMNSIAYSPKHGLVDPFGGVLDINNRIIRATGNAKERFEEDAIRILRGLRFASNLGFDFDDSTANALVSSSFLLSKVHPARLRKELSGLLTGGYVFDVLSKYRDTLAVIIPEIEPMFNTTQNNPHHIYDVWNHTIKALSNSKNTELVRLCVLLHDIGKPFLKTTDSVGVDHFKKHQLKSAEIATDILRRFGYPSKFISDVTMLVRYHDERFRNLRYDIKRLLNILGENLFFTLTDVISSDISAQSEYKREEKYSHLELVVKTAKEILDGGECFSLSQLSVNGNDLHVLGFQGKDIGLILNKLLDDVMRERVSNVKEPLLKRVCSIKIH